MSPPPGRGRRVTPPLCARVTARTMDNPRPKPASPGVASVGGPASSRRNGSNSASAWSAGTQGSAVDDLQGRGAGTDAGAEDEPAVAVIVPDRVGDQVADQAFKQHRVAVGGSRTRVKAYPYAGRGGLRAGLRQDVGGNVGEVHRSAFGDVQFAGGQGQHRVDEPFVAGVDGQEGASQRGRGWRDVGFVERHVDQCPVDGQRGAQLVRGVGGESALRVDERRCAAPLVRLTHLTFRRRDQCLVALGRQDRAVRQSQTGLRAERGVRPGTGGFEVLDGVHAHPGRRCCPWCARRAGMRQRARCQRWQPPGSPPSPRADTSTSP